jgi:hypothetical protein
VPYFQDIAHVIEKNVDVLRATGALAARPGRTLDADGYPTARRVIVLYKHAGSDLAGAPAELADFPIEQRDASPLQFEQFTDPYGFAERARISPPEYVPSPFPGQVLLQTAGNGSVSTHASKSTIPYTAPTDANLDPLPSTNIKMICSVSPDNGWNVLESFLNGTQRTLTVAMYDCTSAHVEQTLATSLIGKSFELVLDHPAKDASADQTDEQTVQLLRTALGGTFAQEWALTPENPNNAPSIFPSAYHIKVAVRDTGTPNSALWLSSGNWNNSNQPVFDWSRPDQALAEKSDRDWHIVVFNDDLATTFQRYIDHDFTVAKQENGTATSADIAGRPQPLTIEDAATAAAFTDFVEEVTIQEDMLITPLLTPDPGIYVGRIKQLIDAATTSFDLQLQYITSFAGADDTAFDGLIQSLAAAEQRGVAVRMIFSEFQQESILELMQEANLAIDHDHVRIQNNVHNKGMLVDGTTTVVSSQNWSGDGVLRNRDAGLIIENARVNAYFLARFNYDWANLATGKPATSTKIAA